MIGIITQNNTLLSALKALLSDFPAEECRTSSENLLSYEALLLADPLPEPMPELSPTIPVITMGTTLSSEVLHLETPIAPATLIRRIKTFLEQSRQTPYFENSFFVFQGRTRTLTDKKSGAIIPLTEKENALLCCLASATPHPVSREELLTSVWNYRPDTETHTVESHIYILRQKIGEKADLLIQNTPAGYVLITD